MAEAKHTPGRLKVNPHTGWIVTEGDPYGHGSMHVADVRGWGHLTGVGACNLDEETAYAIQQANAQRIVATWNACEGIPTEALEKGESIEAAFTRGFAGGKVVGRADVEGVVRGMLSLLEQVDVVMDGAASQGVGDILGPQYREEWARVHTAVREVLARVRGEAS